MEGKITKYGEFSLNGDEYLINTPETPQPWRNVICNDNYCLVVAQNGVGFSYLRPSGHLVTDRPMPGQMAGRYIYLRDNDSEKFWNIGWYPTTTKLDEFKASHRPGSTTISSVCGEISAEVTFTVAQNEPTEVWQVEIENLSKKKRRLSLFVYCHWHNYPGTAAVFRGNEIITKQPLQDGLTLQSFLTLDHVVDSFDCDAEHFIGTYGTIASPQAVVDGKCARSESSDNPVGVLQKNITLGPTTSSKFNVILGAVINKTGNQITGATIKKLVRECQDNSLSPEHWKSKLEKSIIRTPNEELNRYLNYFIKYQGYIGNSPDDLPTVANLACKLTNQIPFRESETREELLALFRYQFKSGETTERIDSSNPDFSLLGAVALCQAVNRYLTTTGETELLKERVSFFDSGSVSVLEHLVRLTQVISKSLKNTPERHSFIERCQLIESLKETLPILSLANESDLVKRYERQVEDAPKTITKFTIERGRVHLSRAHEFTATNQLWAIISSSISNKQKELLFNSTVKLLASSTGLLETTSPGRINSSTLALFIRAATMLDRSDLALQLLEKQWPMELSNQPGRYRAEPYFFANHVHSPGTTKTGQASTELDMLSAGNIWQAVTENIIGIQPVIGGLKVDPKIPRNWRQLDVSREFRGAVYNIRIHNPLRVTSGVDRYSINGMKMPGNVIRPYRSGSHFVEVILG